MAVHKVETLEVSEKSNFKSPVAAFNGLPLRAADAISTLVGYQVYADDFLIYTGPNTAGEAGGWLLTEVAAGGGNTGRVDIDDSKQFGYLKLKTDNGTADEEVLEMNGEPWRYVVGKKLWFFTKFQVDDVDKVLLLLGLAISDTAPLAAVTDGLYFRKASAAVTALEAVAEKNSVEAASTNLITITDNVDVIVGFVVDSAGAITIYGGASLAAMTVIDSLPAGNACIPDDEDLHLSINLQTSETTAHSMSIDWIIIGQER